jgi:hypothetical protein
MMEQVMSRGAKFGPAVLALLAVLIGAECVRAGVSNYEATGSIVAATAPTDLVAAELDPVFMQKLAQRCRASFERAHAMSVQQRDRGS